MELSIPPLAKSVLDYWFGDAPVTPATVKAQSPIWFSGSKNIDFDIERRFGKLVSLASSGMLDSWMEEPTSGVALIVLLDQFPRNIHRGTAGAFAQDRKALLSCYKLIELEGFSLLNPLFQSFSLLPLEHSESIVDQNRCVEEFKNLLRVSDPEWEKMLSGYLDYAQQHRKIIEQFGRFPHRNGVLGRESTSTELAYLNEGASSFGQ
jgi:uncharacterized protein (DUF924 family)